MISTGNNGVDYAITYTLSCFYSLTRFFVVQFHQFLLDYPDLAMVFLVFLGAILSYYLLKNLVRIVYSIIMTTIKLLLIIAIAFVGAWVYLRGVDSFTNDLKTVVDYTTNYHSNGTELEEQFQQYGQEAKTIWGFMYKWAAHQVQQ